MQEVLSREGESLDTAIAQRSERSIWRSRRFESGLRFNSGQSVRTPSPRVARNQSYLFGLYDVNQTRVPAIVVVRDHMETKRPEKCRQDGANPLAFDIRLQLRRCRLHYIGLIVLLVIDLGRQYREWRRPFSIKPRQIRLLTI